MQDKITTVTYTDSHSMYVGDVIIITTIRDSLFDRVVALFVGLFYYTHLPRKLNQFVKTKVEKGKITSVTNTTLAIRNHHYNQRGKDNE